MKLNKLAILSKSIGFLVSILFLLFSCNQQVDNKSSDNSNNVTSGTSKTEQTKVEPKKNVEEKTLQQPELPEIKNGWKRIHLDGHCTFDIPPTMEIQSGLYKEFVNKLQNELKVKGPKFVAQQNGMNEMNQVSKHYARVLVDEAERGGDFSTVTSEEVNEYTTALKQELEIGLAKTGGKLIELLSAKIEVLNGMYCFHYCYKRQINDNPIVIVNTYRFQTNDKAYTLTLSYRINESDIWESDFNLILKSFRIR